jgi:ubiquitin-conjugating enzyme E2 T
MANAKLARLKKELDMLANDPGPGVSAWPVRDNMMNLEAQIEGPQDSPYKNGIYLLSIEIPDRYPFEPPRVRFITPIYHPNIDSDGRICLDTLKMQPQGSWSPSVNINTLLLTIRILMSTPNADDGLEPEITEEFKRDRNLWWRKASEHARVNAGNKTISVNSTLLGSTSQTSTGVTMQNQASADKEGNQSSGHDGNSESDGGDESDENEGSEEGEESGSENEKGSEEAVDGVFSEETIVQNDKVEGCDEQQHERSNDLETEQPQKKLRNR